MNHTRKSVCSLLGLAAFAVSASANIYLGGGLGVADGIDDLDTGTSASFTFGYELNPESRTRHAFEATLVGHSFDDDGSWNGELTMAYAMATYRLTQYFQSPDVGFFGFVGGSLGLASAELELDYPWAPDFEDSGIPAARIFLGVGYAITPHWRVQAAYSRFALDDAKDHGVTFLERGGYNSFELGFDYVF